MRLSVNVWTPELHVFHETDNWTDIDFRHYLVDHDPDDLIEESKNAWRCIGKNANTCLNSSTRVIKFENAGRLNIEWLLVSQPFHSHDLISNSPYCLSYNSYNVSLDHFVPNQLITPELFNS